MLIVGVDKLMFIKGHFDCGWRLLPKGASRIARDGMSLNNRIADNSGADHSRS
jgi:hypothetical protein